MWSADPHFTESPLCVQIIYHRRRTLCCKPGGNNSGADEQRPWQPQVYRVHKPEDWTDVRICTHREQTEFRRIRVSAKLPYAHQLSSVPMLHRVAFSWIECYQFNKRSEAPENLFISAPERSVVLPINNTEGLINRLNKYRGSVTQRESIMRWLGPRRARREHKSTPWWVIWQVKLSHSCGNDWKICL